MIASDDSAPGGAVVVEPELVESPAIPLLMIVCPSRVTVVAGISRYQFSQQGSEIGGCWTVKLTVSISAVVQAADVRIHKPTACMKCLILAARKIA